jgi:F-type H+-transporting ATPase subunit b
MEHAYEYFWLDPKFWVAVSFVLFLILAWKPLIAKILAALDGRAARIRAEIDEATKLRQEAEAMLREAKARREAAAAEAEQILAHAREEAKLVSTEMAEELAAAMKRRERMAMERIAAAEAEAAAAVRAVAADVAVAATRKLIAEGMSGAGHAALIDKAITDLPQRLH